MKRILFFLFVVLVTITTSCDKDPVINNSKGKGDKEDLQHKITMTTQKTDITVRIAGSGSITIDWGDMTEIQTYSIRGFGIMWETVQEIRYKYSNLSTHTITISGDNITHLGCFDNGLSYLDISKNNTLISLNCNMNSLTQLDVSKNTTLSSLRCYNNQLTSLDVSALTELTFLSCQTNKLSSLDLKNNTKLQILDCGPNQIRNLDLSNNTELVVLMCGDNKIVSLDLSKNTKLTDVTCDTNQLTELNVSGLAQLAYLHCGRWINYSEGPGNLLTQLDVSGCASLSYLDCGYNRLSVEAMNSLFETLNETTISTGKDVLIFNNPGTDDCDRKIAENKGWWVTDLLIKN